MTVEHSTLTGSELHEPKGISSANDQEVYVANGAGSGSWTALPYVLTAYLADVSTSGQIYVVCPVDGTITKIYTALNGAIITADAAITTKIAGTAITGGTITITQSGSAAGDIDSCTPTANNTITAGQAVEIETDGSSGNTVPVMITILIERTA